MYHMVLALNMRLAWRGAQASSIGCRPKSTALGMPVAAVGRQRTSAVQLLEPLDKRLAFIFGTTGSRPWHPPAVE